jgi:hypothetical protein
MRALLALVLVLPFAGCDDENARGLCEDRGQLYCANPSSCCDRCRGAANGSVCTPGPACEFGGSLNGTTALCGADGLWHLTATYPDLSANLPDGSPDGATDGASEVDAH